MAKLGNIFLTEKNFTDTEVQNEFGFPCILVLHDNNTVIQKITAYDKNGTKTIYDFSLAASKDFVTQSIADAIAGLQDNTLEFPTFADFPATGEVGNIYIDLSEDKVYIWDSVTSEYVSQSWDKTLITNIQNQISALQSNKLDKPSLSDNRVPIWNASGNLSNTTMTFLNGKFGISVSGEPSEMFEVFGGNIKGTLIKDQYGTLRSQRVIPVTGNITLSQIYNGAILHITNTCNITIPTGLGADFACDFYVKGAFIATFVNGGVILNSPSGLLLKTDKMATLYSNASDVFNLLGELATS